MPKIAVFSTILLLYAHFITICIQKKADSQRILNIAQTI